MVRVALRFHLFTRDSFYLVHNLGNAILFQAHAGHIPLLLLNLPVVTVR